MRRPIPCYDSPMRLNPFTKPFRVFLLYNGFRFPGFWSGLLVFSGRGNRFQGFGEHSQWSPLFYVF